MLSTTSNTRGSISVGASSTPRASPPAKGLGAPISAPAAAVVVAPAAVDGVAVAVDGVAVDVDGVAVDVVAVAGVAAGVAFGVDWGRDRKDVADLNRSEASFAAGLDAAGLDEGEDELSCIVVSLPAMVVSTAKEGDVDDDGVAVVADVVVGRDALDEVEDVSRLEGVGRDIVFQPSSSSFSEATVDSRKERSLSQRSLARSHVSRNS